MPTATKKPTPARKRAPARRPTRARRSGGLVPALGRLPVLEQPQIDVIGLALVAAGVFLAFPLYFGWDGGAAGGGLVDGLAWLVGEIRYAAPVALVAAGALLVLRPVLPTLRPFRAGAACLFGALVLAVTAGTLGLGPGGEHGPFWVSSTFEARGGIAGEALFWASTKLVGTIGAHILAVFGMLAGVLLLTGASVAGVLAATATAAADTTRAFRRADAADSDGPPAWDGAPEPSGHMLPPEPEELEDDDVIRATDARAELDGAVRYPDLFGDGEPAVLDRRAAPEEEPPAPAPGGEREEPPAGAAGASGAGAAGPGEPRDPAAAGDRPALPIGEQARLDLGEDVEWHRPGPALLKRTSPENQRPDTRGQEHIAQRLVEALSHFKVDAKVVGTVAGPHITRYELLLAPGTKMSKVSQMKDDLAYALAATEIRILAPIPGKQAVGVEVPNAKRKMVTLGDVYGPPPPGSSPLTVWLGKDVSGKAIPADLAKMPHLLVAGTTGAGKSGCINAMLSSVLLRATPEEVRLVLVDPKQVELNHYEEIPHLLTPVITSPRKAANALQNLVKEMEWRYGIMSMARTRSLPELNKHRLANDQDPLPYILCVIDELADLMMVAPADVEDSIIRIAQKARAVGIHLVLATQSPRVDVITGMIKANVPSRIAFSVSSQTDSRVILDHNGAESLLGMGDMLFSAVGSSKLHRIQGAYIDEAQIAKLTAFWAAQGEPEIREDLLAEVVAEDDGGGQAADDAFDPDEDPLLGDAIELVVEMGTASTSMLQRRLRLGYTRAGRLIDMLERRGVISGYEGSKPRQVLVSAPDLPRVLAALGGAAAPDEEPTAVRPAPLPDAGDVLDAAGDEPGDGPLGP
jgi:DNA segregation ATPase FtsK/SpoIIIE, S-DNA-T family